MQTTRRRTRERHAAPQRHVAPSPDEPARSIVVKPRTVWLVAGALAALFLAWLTVSQAIGALILIFIAIVFAEGLRPIVDWLGRGHVPRPLTVLALYVLIFLAFAVVAFLLLRPFVAQVERFINDLPHYMAKAQQLLSHIQHVIGHNPQVSHIIAILPSQIGGYAQNILSLVVKLPMMLASILFKVIEMLLLSFFWLTATAGLRGFVVGLFPAHLQDHVSDVITELSHDLGGYLRGVVINMIVIATLSSVGLALLGVPYAILLGILAGLTETLPIIGPWISGAAAVGVALLAIGPLKAGEVALLFEAIQLIEGNTLVPYVMYRTTSVNPLVVLISVIVGGAVLGIVGAVVGVPAGVVVAVLVRQVLAPVARHASAHVSKA